MAATISPLPGFDWSKVKWGGPNEPVAIRCSYCDAPLGDDMDEDYQGPLILWSPEGACAQFCIACQKIIWGFGE